MQACAGVEAIRQGPPESDHMANGRVEMAVREVKGHCRTLRVPAEQKHKRASQMAIRYSARFSVLQLTS